MTSSTESPSSPNQASLTLYRSVFLVSFPFFILEFLLPIYGKEIGASVMQIGLFFSAFSIMTVVLRPVIGWAVDHYGRRFFVISGLAGYTVAMAGFAFVDQVVSMVLARIIQGIASSLFWLSANAIIADTADEAERGRAFGGLAQSSSQGSIAGAFVGFALLNLSFALTINGFPVRNWTVLFGCYALVSLLAGIIALRQLPETRPVQRQAVLSTIRWSRPWILLLLITLATGASWAMITPIMVIFLQENLTADISVLSRAFLPVGLVWAIMPSRLGSLADRFGRKPLMLISLGMAGLSSIMIPQLTTIAGLSLLWAFQALCYAAGDPAEQALVADLTGGDQRGRAYGFYVMAADLGAAFGPFIGAWLYQSIGPQVPFYANGIMLVACTVIIAAFLRPPERGLTETSLP